jgi:hypothetical protein
LSYRIDSRFRGNDSKDSGNDSEVNGDDSEFTESTEVSTGNIAKQERHSEAVP